MFESFVWCWTVLVELNENPFYCFRRTWFSRAKNAPTKTVISNAYMDSAGVGKIITISQAVFEGLPVFVRPEDCRGLKKGGCDCISDKECLSGEYSVNYSGFIGLISFWYIVAGRCYMSTAAPFVNELSPRCATERVEAVTSLDMLYNDFYNQNIQIMESTVPKDRGCGK